MVHRVGSVAMAQNSMSESQSDWLKLAQDLMSVSTLIGYDANCGKAGDLFRMSSSDKHAARSGTCERVPSGAVWSIASDVRSSRHGATRPTIVQQRATVGVYGHVSTPPAPRLRGGVGRGSKRSFRWALRTVWSDCHAGRNSDEKVEIYLTRAPYPHRPDLW